MLEIQLSSSKKFNYDLSLEQIEQHRLEENINKFYLRKKLLKMIFFQITINNSPFVHKFWV